MSQQPTRLLDQVRACLRRKHYLPRTERAYVSWIGRYVLFHNRRHPIHMRRKEIEDIRHVVVDDPGILQDLELPEDYEEALAGSG